MDKYREMNTYGLTLTYFSDHEHIQIRDKSTFYTRTYIKYIMDKICIRHMNTHNICNVGSY